MGLTIRTEPFPGKQNSTHVLIEWDAPVADAVAEAFAAACHSDGAKTLASQLLHARRHNLRDGQTYYVANLIEAAGEPLRAELDLALTAARLAA